VEIISLIGSVQTFFYLLLFGSKTQKALSDYILILFLFLLGAMFFDNYLRNTHFYELHPQYWGITYCFPILSGPLLYYYVVLITKPKQKFHWSDLLFGAPFLTFLLYFFFTYYNLPVQEKLLYYRQATNNPWPMIYAAEFFIVFSGPAYAILGLFKLHKHTKNIAHGFSYSDGISLSWLRTIFVLLVLVNILTILSNVFSDLIPFVTYKTADNIAFAINVAFIFFLGYKGFKQKLIYNPGSEIIDIEQEVEPGTVLITVSNDGLSKYSKSGLNDSDGARYYAKLINLIESEELYLNEKLTIKNVADRLGISVNHMSQIINQQSGKNFFRFVNEYRVEKAKALLCDPSNQKYSILGLAFDCGFNSKSSFNAIFKQYTGKTPSEFQQIPNPI